MSLRPGAGIYPIAPSGRMLLGLRADWCNNPHEWAGFGGAQEPGESLIECAVRELREETGYCGPLDLQLVTSTIYIGYVPYEFVPALNAEHELAEWFTCAEVLGLQPKHRTLRRLLARV